MISEHDVMYLSKHDVSVLSNIKAKSRFQPSYVCKINIRFTCGKRNPYLKY